MSDVVSLNSKRAEKSGDCRDWTPLDALRETVAKIESGEWDADMIYIAIKTKPGADGRYGLPSRCAGTSRIESIGLLQEHLHATLMGG